MVTVAPVITEPKITTAQMMDQFTLVAAYTTKTTSEANRNTNIRLACEAINGTALMPGQVFGSTVSIMSNGEALFRYVCASLYFSFSLMTLGTMALMFSAVFNRMSAAALAVITIYFVSYIAAALPFAGVLRPWLISEIMNNAFLFWLTPFPMEKLLLNLALLAMYICGFLVAAICIFNYKDIR